jgi:hypothetical protein
MATRQKCPNGTRKNRKTGLCEPYTPAPRSPTRRKRSTPNAKQSASPRRQSGPDSMVVIQHSCDPFPLDDVKDTIYEQRLEVDAQGLRNGEAVWQYLKSQKKSDRKSTELLTPLVNEDFTMQRFIQKTKKYEPPQGFFEYAPGAGSEKKLLTAQKKLVKKMKPSIDPESFVEAIRSGTIIYMPIHGGHPLDEHEPGDSFYQLPPGMYVISFNPPNSNALFLCGEAQQEFLEFVANPEALLMLSQPSNRKRVFESEFYKNMRVWGPDNMVTNRGIIPDRDADLMRRAPGAASTPFSYLKKSQFRSGIGTDLEYLYTALDNTRK